MQQLLKAIYDKYEESFSGTGLVKDESDVLFSSVSGLHDTRKHSGFIALEDGAVVGYILYNLSDGDCEITVLESIIEGRGVGRKLIGEVLRIAKEADCSRVWLITTNDNTHAIRFYQRFGFELRAVYINAMETARKLKPQIPLTGCDDISIKHEFEFEIILRYNLDYNSAIATILSFPIPAT